MAFLLRKKYFDKIYIESACALWYNFINKIYNMEVYPMPRPKGSKNKPKAAKVTTDFAAAIAEKTAEKAQLEQNIADTLEQINGLKAQLKSNRAALKSAEETIAKLETKKASADAKAALNAQKTELDSTVEKLLSEGLTMEEILGRLNG